jgi:hypothetical protein
MSETPDAAAVAETPNYPARFWVNLVLFFAVLIAGFIWVELYLKPALSVTIIAAIAFAGGIVKSLVGTAAETGLKGWLQKRAAMWTLIVLLPIAVVADVMLMRVSHELRLIPGKGLITYLNPNFDSTIQLSVERNGKPLLQRPLKLQTLYLGNLQSVDAIHGDDEHKRKLRAYANELGVSDEARYNALLTVWTNYKKIIPTEPLRGGDRIHIVLTEPGRSKQVDDTIVIDEDEPVTNYFLRRPERTP